MTHGTTGHIRQGAGAAIAALRARAVEWELEARDEGGALILPLWGGDLRADAADPGLRLAIRAPDKRLVQVIRDAVAELLASEGIAVEWEAVETGALAPGLSLMRVAAVGQRSAGFLRVRLSGPEAARFARDGLHFRLLLPPAGRVPVWPRIAATGRTVWPVDEDALHRPVYTVAAQGDDWLDFDIWRHAGSPTCDWAETVAPGAEVGIVGPGGGWCPEAPRLMLFGDETALPAIARMLHLAGGRACAQVTVAEGDLCGVDAKRVPDLLPALAQAEITPGTHVWFAGREDQARAARALLAARGLGKKDFTAAAYWS